MHHLLVDLAEISAVLIAAAVFTAAVTVAIGLVFLEDAGTPYDEDEWDHDL